MADCGPRRRLVGERLRHLTTAPTVTQVPAPAPRPCHVAQATSSGVVQLATASATLGAYDELSHDGRSGCCATSRCPIALTATHCQGCMSRSCLWLPRLQEVQLVGPTLGDRYAGSDCGTRFNSGGAVDCSDGVLDTEGTCCSGFIDTRTGLCCGEGVPVDRDGVCCHSARGVDPCGVCGGDCIALDVRGVPCAAPLPPSGVCCTPPLLLDSCGVCGGVNACGAVVNLTGTLAVDPSTGVTSSVASTAVTQALLTLGSMLGSGSTATLALQPLLSALVSSVGPSGSKTEPLLAGVTVPVKGESVRRQPAEPGSTDSAGIPPA